MPKKNFCEFIFEFLQIFFIRRNFEIIPVATRFNPDPLDSLKKETFGQCPNLRLC